MSPERIINVHAHLHHRQNVAERIKLWRSYNVVKVRVLCLYPYVQNPPMGGYYTNNHRPYMLDKIARAFPKLKMIGAHLGKPHAEEALQMLIYLNVYYDFSGGSGRKPHELWITRALSPLVPDANMSDPAENPALEYFKKFCFATDNPEPPVWIECGERIMNRLHIPSETRERFYWRNAADIFGWKESDL